jgi:hypothetical protein
MLVPAARDLRMRLVLAEGVSLRDTWGYRNHEEENTVHYYLPTLHNGDYETMLAELSVKRAHSAGTLGNFYLDYVDLENNQRSLGPYQIDIDSPLGTADPFITDPRVREAEGYLVLSRGLIDIGGKAIRVSQLQSELTQYSDPSPQRADAIEQINVELTQNLELVERLRDYLTDISDSLGGGKYEKELEILHNYDQTFTEVYNVYNTADEAAQ